MIEEGRDWPLRKIEDCPTCYIEQVDRMALNGTLESSIRCSNFWIFIFTLVETKVRVSGTINGEFIDWFASCPP